MILLASQVVQQQALRDGTELSFFCVSCEGCLNLARVHDLFSRALCVTIWVGNNAIFLPFYYWLANCLSRMDETIGMNVCLQNWK